MKKYFLLPFLLASFIYASGQTKKKPVPKPAVPSANGYDIKLSVKPYRNQWLYLAYYYGGIKGLADSAWLDVNSNGSFKGKAPLPQGIYIVASPSKTILFEMLQREVIRKSDACTPCC